VRHKEVFVRQRHTVFPVWITLVAFLILTTAPQLFAQGVSVRPFPRRPEPIPDRYIVMLRAGLDPLVQTQRLAQQHGLSVGFVYQNAIQGFSAMIPPGRLAQIQSDPAVLLVEPDLIVRAVQTVPTGVARIGATQNGYAAIDGVDDRVDIDVAVIDTGIDYTHPDLNVVARTDCVDYDLFVIFFGFPATCVNGQGTDGNNHGTHVAGTIGALDNGIGVVGVAPGARLWAVRVLEADGTGYLSWLVAGMDYVAAHASEIEVANMSLGWLGNSTAARTAVQNAVNQGVVFVAAAGNDGADIHGADGQLGTADDFEPAAYPEVATISALADSDGAAGGLGSATAHGPDDTLATFSNRSAVLVPGNPVNSPGRGIDLAAPGVDIYSTLPVVSGGYGTGSGTSMASPHATGAVALYIAANGRANNASGVAAIRQALINAAQAQTLWGPADTRDLDGYREGLAYVSSGSGPPVNPPPVVIINSPANGAEFPTGSSILFAGTANDDSDGELTNSMSWSSSKDGVIGTGGNFNKTLTDGLHTITASATDSGGRTGSSSVSIKVGCVPTTFTVTSITYSLSNKRKNLNVTVTLKDNCGKPVVGASVEAWIWNLTVGGLWWGVGTTNSSGQEIFLLQNAPSGTYTTDIMNASANGLTWDGRYPANSYKKK
jgi:subtilisin family serine protease